MLGAIMDMTAPAAFHSGIVTSRFVATCEFYFELFGFAPLEITEDYALLGRSDGARLALLQAGADGQPAALSQPTRGQGMWLTFESDDVEALHTRLVARGIEIVCDPEDTLSGQRRCIARDPNGVLVYVTSRRVADDSSVSPNRSETKHHEDHRSRLHRLSCH